MSAIYKLDRFSLDLSDLDPGVTSGAEAKRRLENAHGTLRARFASGEVGFYDWPEKIEARELDAMASVSRRLRQEFEGALILGIGGSYLGPAAVFQALREPAEEDAFPIGWVSNIDGNAIRRADHLVRNRRLATVVISKSGGTTETLSAFFHFAPKLDPKGYVAITDPKTGELRRLAEANRWASFPVPPNVGGRYSVLTAVGLLPAYLGGLAAEELIAGAREMRRRLEACAPAENPAYLLAYAQYVWDVSRHHSVQYLMPYSSQLRLFADWNVQLWGESIGKRQRANPDQAVGFTPVAALGTSDQHSLLQLFKEGPNNKIIGFLDVLDSGRKTLIGEPPFAVDALKFLFPHSFEEVSHLAGQATQASLRNSGVPTYRIELPNADARALGALFFFFETACAFAGELYEVDAFNQPGVEEAKRLLRAAL